ncbi:helix-turn-helix domain-containing protein [Leucobacter ruminantium]|uniref:Helix-turn-helix transcriptional regulator n=1 Tax=Leucobacter ruminantium TaxID=1289170 RepID=A0A939LW64_9MICO|nr:helix-turn-helix transcriptional regulator [Leucobacter ruminantium]MBO1805879.1 helix-turn-helix transcriptional regulator [Leucobacter ruminantium]
MSATIRIKEGLLKRLRESRHIPTEEVQARMIGVDRVTLRRIDKGATPSAAFMAGVAEAFGLGLGEAFDVVEVPSLRAPQPAEQREAVGA